MPNVTNNPRASDGGHLTEPEKTTPKRINVAVNPETMAALQNVIERENVSLTEAVRRLIGYGDVLYRAVREENEELLLKKGNTTRQVIIL